MRQARRTPRIACCKSAPHCLLTTKVDRSLFLIAARGTLLPRSSRAQMPYSISSSCPTGHGRSRRTMQPSAAAETLKRSCCSSPARMLSSARSRTKLDFRSRFTPYNITLLHRRCARLVICAAIDLFAARRCSMHRTRPPQPRSPWTEWPSIASDVPHRLSGFRYNSPPRATDCRGRLIPPRGETGRELYCLAAS